MKIQGDRRDRVGELYHPLGVMHTQYAIIRYYSLDSICTNRPGRCSGAAKNASVLPRGGYARRGDGRAASGAACVNARRLIKSPPRLVTRVVASAIYISPR